MAEKETIAIMTYWGYNDNYGQLMQAYALSTYLKKLGYEPRLIRYDHMNDNSLKRSLVSRIYTMAYKPSQLTKVILDRVSHLFSKSSYSSCPCADSFESFKKKHLDWTQYYPNYQSLIENPPSADIYICGSDMIWAETAFVPDPFFLAFGRPKKRIAYAPSFGRKKISKPYERYIKNLLNRFDAVSVREDSGVEICETIGKYGVECVPDPTLLLTKEEYSVVEVPFTVKSKYIFAYILGDEDHTFISQLKHEANENNLELLYRSAQSGKEEGFDKAYPTPGQWLYIIKNARYVVTNSFHGVIFSIIYRKQFTFLPIKGRNSSWNERIFSILNKLGLQNKVIARDKILHDHNDLYTSEVERKLQSFIMKGENFLTNNLDVQS